MGNQPQSTNSNKNTKDSKKKEKAPSKAKKTSYRKYKKTGKDAQKRYDNKQTAQINKLTKEVNALQMAKYGSIQQNYHTISAPLGVGPVPNGNLGPATPFCFDLTDFTCGRGDIGDGCRIYRYDATLPVPITEASNFIKTESEGNFYWENQNEDQPDGGSYLAMDATYFIEVRGNRSLDNTRVRFDVVSQKPNTIQALQALSTDASLALPDTLKYMKNLCEPHKNRINPSYFAKWKTKIVYINSTKINTNTKGTTGNIIRFSFTIKPNKVCVQNETNPQVGGGAVVFEDTGDIGAQTEILRGNFGPLNVPETQPLWMVISCDDQDTTDNQRAEVRISRRIRWRDALGSSAI